MFVVSSLSVAATPKEIFSSSSCWPCLRQRGNASKNRQLADCSAFHERKKNMATLQRDSVPEVPYLYISLRGPKGFYFAEDCMENMQVEQQVVKKSRVDYRCTKLETLKII